MSWTLLVIGIALVMLAIVDALWTTVWTEGVAGPVSSWLSRLMWKLWIKLVPTRARKLHSIAGPYIMLSVVGLWVIMIWLGWSLVFASSVTALINTSDQTYPDLIGRIYFAAMAVFTMGNGDMAPVGNGWRIATALANANGFLMLTLVISYVLSVLSAEVLKRAFAREVTSLGKHGMEFITSGWNGKNLRDLELPLNNITSQLGRLTEHHLAYPILHYFQPLQSGASSIVAIAILEDALAALTHAVPEDCAPSRASRRALKGSLDDYYNTASTMPSLKPSDLPPAPPVAFLTNEGISCHVSQEEFSDHIIKDRSDTRKFVNGCLEEARWQWPTEDHTAS